MDRKGMKEYRLISGSLPVYETDQLDCLVTQAWEGRHILLCRGDDDPDDDRSPRCKSVFPPIHRGVASHSFSPQRVTLCNDGYQGRIAPEDFSLGLEPIEESGCPPYKPVALRKQEIDARIPSVIKFAMAAYKVKNQYLWGGTTGPDYDCNGLVQRAFAAAGICVPRDAYQQEAFSKEVLNTDLKTGDLLFFGDGNRATHVGICLGLSSNREVERKSQQHSHLSAHAGSPPAVMYLHSSGVRDGHGHIAIDFLAANAGREAAHYFSQFRGGRRIVRSYKPPYDSY